MRLWRRHWPQRSVTRLSWQNSMDAMAAIEKPKTKPRILPLQRRNLTAGAGHIMDDIISRAGGINLGRNDKADTMRRISLENALAARADFILLNETQATADSRGMEFFTHPALALHYADAQRLHLSTIIFWSVPVRQPRAPLNHW